MQNIAIYGAGAFGKIFYKSLDGKIDFFIDDFSNQTSIFNIPIKKLTEISLDTKIYISILQQSKKVEVELRNKGFKNIINFTDSAKSIQNLIYNTSQNNYLWLVADKKKMINDKKLLEVKKLLKDDKSKQLLEQIINLRKTLDNKYYVEPAGVEYFPDDVPILKNLNTINFIDCGAYIGDSILELFKHSSNVGFTVSFEPDSSNLLKLSSELEILKNKFPKTNFFVYPVGIYSKNDILKFSNNYLLRIVVHCFINKRKHFFLQNSPSEG